jgi:hypothetical protein
MGVRALGVLAWSGVAPYPAGYRDRLRAVHSPASWFVDLPARIASAILLLLAIVAAVGCGSPPVPASAPIVPPGPTLELRPLGPGAASYNEPRGAPTPDEPADRIAALVATVAAATGRAAPRRDARLDAVCAELARVLPEEGATPFDLVEFTLQHVGIIEPPPHLVIATLGEDAAPGFDADLKERLPGVLESGRYRRLGIGSVAREGGRRVVIALQETFITTDAFPRQLAQGQSARLRGRVLAPFTGPRVYITRPDGEVDRLPPGSGRDAFDTLIACQQGGRYQVEVTADDPFGATVLANFPVYCAIGIPGRALIAHGDGGPVEDPAAAEGRLLQLLNEDRRQARLPPLAWHARLAEVARAHCRDMEAHGFVGHVSPRSGSPAERVRRAGVVSDVVLENVARAYSLGEAQRGLMQSPGHRRNILSPSVTDVGIGVVLGREVAGRREVYVTQLFVSVGASPPAESEHRPTRRPR